MFGCIDLVAFDPENDITILIQVCNKSSKSSRKKKMLESPELKAMKDMKSVSQCLFLWFKDSSGRWQWCVEDFIPN
jgi:hypothetical protein